MSSSPIRPQRRATDLGIDDIATISEALVKRTIEIIVSIIALFVVWNEWSDSGVI